MKNELTHVTGGEVKMSRGDELAHVCGTEVKYARNAERKRISVNERPQSFAWPHPPTGGM